MDLWGPKLWAPADILKDDAFSDRQECEGVQIYRCATDALFLKRSADPTSDKILRLKRALGTEVHTTGQIWTGPGGGIWAELKPPASQQEGHGGWALVQGPGFGLRAPALASPEAVPKCFVFDLDNCVWTPELQDLEAGSPFVYDPALNECVAAGGRGEKVKLLGDIPALWQAVLTEPHFQGASIAIASACSEPSWAHQLLSHFEIDGKKMRDCIAHTEIHSGSKQGHLAEIATKLGIGLGDLVFFDDRAMHCSDVLDLNIISVEVPQGGVTHAAFNMALKAFAKKQWLYRQARNAR